ncbi:hypothetical protein WAF17_21005 [Bernardetia sp. ABR2-2B]|uniref:hypothetical protein n=1 Tax=Bernardetia sp. ABR2-2B TaxID=3127472 RepID=UPI0030D083C8
MKYYCIAKLPKNESKHTLNTLFTANSGISKTYLGNGEYQVSFPSLLTFNLFVNACHRRRIFITQTYSEDGQI